MHVDMCRHKQSASYSLCLLYFLKHFFFHIQFSSSSYHLKLKARTCFMWSPVDLKALESFQNDLDSSTHSSSKERRTLFTARSVKRNPCWLAVNWMKGQLCFDGRPAMWSLTSGPDFYPFTLYFICLKCILTRNQCGIWDMLSYCSLMNIFRWGWCQYSSELTPVCS